MQLRLGFFFGHTSARFAHRPTDAWKLFSASSRRFPPAAGRRATQRPPCPTSALSALEFASCPAMLARRYRQGLTGVELMRTS
jgi:hypothetical protein